jgi:hypothetical protein
MIIRVLFILFCIYPYVLFGHEYSFVNDSIQDTKVRFSFTLNGKDTCVRAKIKALDAVTKEEKYVFEVNGSCSTDSSTFAINEGNYNFIADLSHISLKKSTIKQNKTNYVFFELDDPILQFTYIDKREVPANNMAIVNKPLPKNKTVLQRCSEKKQYPPGHYFIEINTLPASKFSIDLTIGAVYEIQIPEPGTLQITNTSPFGKIQLQSVLGDEYLTFKTMEITGNLEDQQLIVQPGPYKAIVPVNPAIPQAGTKVIEFRVTSNKLTELKIE